MDALTRDTCSVRVLLLCGCLFSPGLPCRGGRKTFCPGKFLESESSEWDITPAGAGCGSSLLSPFLLSHPVLLQCLCTEQLRPESQSHKEKPPLRFPLRSPLRLRAEQSAPNLQGSLEVGQAPLWESPRLGGWAGWQRPPGPRFQPSQPRSYGRLSLGRAPEGVLGVAAWKQHSRTWPLNLQLLTFFMGGHQWSPPPGV